MKKNLLVLMGSFLVIIIASCSQKHEAESPCGFVTNSDGARVSWKSSATVNFYIDQSVPANFYRTIEDAAITWNQSIGREVIKIAGWASTKTQPAADGANVIYYLNTWDNNDHSEQARTTLRWSGDRIQEADILLNARDFSFFVGDQIVSGQVDLKSLILHELGHALGLQHASIEAQSVMAKTLANATLRRALSEYDVKSIKCEY